jgi:2,4-didehydro-3-deoxy-L-rhamnonate hydrolase
LRLVSYLGPDDAGTALLSGDRLIPLMEGFLTPIELDPIALSELTVRAQALEGAVGIPMADVDVIAPIPDPGKVICVGLNYHEHAAEGGRPAPARPLLFAKFSNTVIADGDPIVRPEGTRALDLEVELGVVIGTIGRRISRDDAMDHVAGYVVVNDVSARDWQGVPAALGPGEVGDGQWLRAKGSDTFLPMGPVFVTADEIPDPQALRLRSWRIPGSGPDDGGEILMQDASTGDMIWSVAELIEFISNSIVLEPGDIIATGTPAGVGVYRDPPTFLQPGDRTRCTIDGIGSVENPVVDWFEVEDDSEDGAVDLDDLLADR